MPVVTKLSVWLPLTPGEVQGAEGKAEMKPVEYLSATVMFQVWGWQDDKETKFEPMDEYRKAMPVMRINTMRLGTPIFSVELRPGEYVGSLGLWEALNERKIFGFDSGGNMKFARIGFVAAVLAMVAGAAVFAGAPAAPVADAGLKPSIFVCGDSTSKYSGSETMTSAMQGWGTPLAKFFDAEKVKIVNVGHAGTSSLTYYQTDWPKVLPQIKKGDFVLIVFGINDGGLMTPNGIGDEVVQGRAGAETHTYGWYLSKMATDARTKGGTPIFLTVTTRNIWTNSNPNVKFKDATPTAPLPADYDAKLDKIERGTGNGRYGDWTKEVGKKIHVPVFDLTNYCADVYEKMGREEVNKLYQDHNHTHAAGAEIVASSIASGLKGLKDSPFVALMNDAGKALPAPDKKYVFDNPEEGK